MDNKINYTLIGVIVSSLLVLLLGFLFWMGKYGFEEQRYDYYTIKMSEGVSGLNVESPVKYRGMEVGTVDNIRIAPDNAEFIEITINVRTGTPVKKDSVAVLASLGITGLSYIEIKGGSHNSPALEKGGTIQAGESLFSKLENSATDISEKLVQTMARLDKLLSPNNIAALEQTLANIQEITLQLSEQIPLFLNEKNSRELEQTLENSNQFSQFMNSESQNIDQFLTKSIELENQAVQTLKQISMTSRTLNKNLLTIQQKLDQGEYDLREMAEPHLEAFNALLKELEMLSIQASEVLHQIKESPSDLIFKQKQYERGPGEQ